MASLDEKAVCVRITDLWRWTPKLFSFRTERPQGFRFSAGQFARLGLSSQGPLSDGNLPDVWRAYSIVSGPYDDYLEFYSVVVPDGAFTSQLTHFQVGDQLYIERQNHGFLTIDRFPLEGDLWMLASGTGLAPFLSILADPETYSHFDRLVLVHSVRELAELAYQDWLRALPEHPVFGEWAHKVVVQPVVTRESSPHPSQRLPALIASEALEASLGIRIDPSRSKVMLCGNPEMVADCRASLKARGLVSARQSRPGQIATENYW